EAPVREARNHTTRVERLPVQARVTGAPDIVKARRLDAHDAAVAAAADGPGARGKLVRGWAAPGVPGPRAHGFLLPGAGQWCLRLADPSTHEAGDRGVGCVADKAFARFGIAVVVGHTYAAVVGPGRPEPTYRAPDRSRHPLAIGDGGLVALARVPDDSAIAL